MNELEEETNKNESTVYCICKCLCVAGQFARLNICLVSVWFKLAWLTSNLWLNSVLRDQVYLVTECLLQFTYQHAFTQFICIWFINF